MKCDDDSGKGGCGPLKLERIRYFTGRHMTARDFSDADGYHRAMRHLHNRVLHGWGIACGLEVTRHQRDECGLAVQCGLAIDCCGREIVVPSAVAQRIAWDIVPQAQDGTPLNKDYVLVLCLEYCEVQTEKVPVLYSEEACSSASYEDGRVRESYALHWHAVKESELEKYGWQLPTGCPPADGDPKPCAGATSPCCLDADCPPHGCVALAVVRGTEEKYEVDTSQRRFIGQAPEHLTHICWISWPHGGSMSVSEFNQVSVRFDRALAGSAGNAAAGPTGINERTFVMQAGEQREDLDFVMYTKVPHLTDGRTAVFDVVRPEQYIGHTVQVTLRCDFILDCRGNPVDGNHLRGRLPTGDGIMGGEFQSWFTVVSDEECKRLTDAANTAGATT